jgi:hypothetical protein
MVKNRETRESFNSDESEQLLRGFLSKALFDNGLYVPPPLANANPVLLEPFYFEIDVCRADTAGPTTGVTPSSSWRPPSYARRSTSMRSR